MTILLTIAVYFAVLLTVSCLTGRGGGNDDFFRAGRRSPWPVVAFGMVGASLSGVTFISVPGMVMGIDMTYLQMCMGFIVGYLLVAFVLLPLYYRYGLTSIYGYLGVRFGRVSHRTGAWFFLLSKLTGAAARLYLVCLILQRYALPHVPFAAIVAGTLLLIWLYTRRGGVRTLVWTDALQTLCLLLALVAILWRTASLLGMDAGQAWQAVLTDPHSRVFEWTDWGSRQHFWKQFLSGVFIVVVMTGLDQDTMQKNLTCRTLRDGQKDLCSYGVLFLPVNALFLALGILLTMVYAHSGTPLPVTGDELLPGLVGTGRMGQGVLALFTIGIIASAFSSADSALTALTTSFCVDILGRDDDTRMRKRVHVGVCLVFILFILAFKAIGSSSVIDAIYTLASYTYGPLLGLFAFGMCTRRMPSERFVPVVAILSPCLCYAVDLWTQHCTSYRCGYELLLLNGLLTFGGLWALSIGHTHRLPQPNRAPSGSARQP